MNEPERQLADSEVLFLVDNGMPTDFAIYAQYLPRLTLFQKAIAFTAFFGVLFIPLFGIAVFPFTPAFGVLLKSIGVVPAEAVLVEANCAFPLILLFAWFGIAGLIFNFAAVFLPKNLSTKIALESVHGCLNAPQYTFLQLGLLKSMIRFAKAEVDDPEVYFRGMHWSLSKLYLIYVIPLLTLMATIAAFELSTVPFTTKNGVSCGRYFSLKRDSFEWREMKKVLIGCGFNDSGMPKPHYKLRFGKEYERDLFRFMDPVNRGQSKLRIVAEVDQILRQHQIPRDELRFTGGINKGKSRYSQKCLQEYRQKQVPKEDWSVFDQVFALE